MSTTFLSNNNRHPEQPQAQQQSRIMFPFSHVMLENARQKVDFLTNTIQRTDMIKTETKENIKPEFLFANTKKLFLHSITNQQNQNPNSTNTNQNRRQLKTDLKRVRTMKKQFRVDTQRKEDQLFELKKRLIHKQAQLEMQIKQNQSKAQAQQSRRQLLIEKQQQQQQQQQNKQYSPIRQRLRSSTNNSNKMNNNHKKNQLSQTVQKCQQV
jgi:hypothetical protein